nr:hypothetical protein GCM10020093_031410 [Planobispora longispora]
MMMCPASLPIADSGTSDGNGGSLGGTGAWAGGGCTSLKAVHAAASRPANGEGLAGPRDGADANARGRKLIAAPREAAKERSHRTVGWSAVSSLTRGSACFHQPVTSPVPRSDSGPRPSVPAARDSRPPRPASSRENPAARRGRGRRPGR